MAKANKYTSVNFNDVFEKKTTPSKTNQGQSPSSYKSPFPYSAVSSSSPSPSAVIANGSRNGLYKAHLTQGRMLVLTRPTSKPISAPNPQPTQVKQPLPDQTRPEPASDPISLRPLGSTGGGDSLLPHPVVPATATSPKTDRFVPPHLRPGFAGREQRPEPEVQSPGGPRQGRMQQGGNGEDRRPKSGGYDRMRRGGESDLSRPSPWNRPSSSG